VTRIAACIFAAAAAAVLGCGSNSGDTAPNPPDVTPPVVSITGPAAGSVSGVVLIQVDATDDHHVKRVTFKVNGGAVGGADSTAPYSYSWDTSLYANGFYDWQAVAYDDAGNTTTSAAVSYAVGF
jgi:hypothetical protein